MPVLTEPFLYGFFNWPILFGVQLYIWLMILGIIVIVGSEFVWRYGYWEPMTPFHGLYRAFVDGTKAALVGDLNLDWALLSESGATVIFDPEYYKFAIAEMSLWIRFRAWIFKPDFSSFVATQLEGKKEEPTLITIGRIPTHLIIDTEWWTDKQNRQRLAIRKFCDKWNREHPNDQIHKFLTFVRYVKEGKITPPEGVVMKKLVPWGRIDSAFPLIRSDAGWAGFVRQIALELEQASNADLNKWAAVILIFSGLICVMMYLYGWIMSLPK